MKKSIKIGAVALLLMIVLALMAATPSLAQGPNPGVKNGPCQATGLMIIDPADMHAAIARTLGISVEEFEAARAEGKPLSLIAQELGVEMDVVREAMNAVRETAIDEALAAGVISDEQAEWLRSQPGAGEYNYGRGLQDGYGPGARAQRRGQGVGRGSGAGWGRWQQ